MHTTNHRSNVYVCACILYVFCMYWNAYLYVSCAYVYIYVCIVCINATNKFGCRKYRQIHTIHTNIHKIHTRYIQKYRQDTGQIYQFISYVLYVSVCICMYHVCIFIENMHSLTWIQADTEQI